MPHVPEVLTTYVQFPHVPEVLTTYVQFPQLQNGLTRCYMDFLLAETYAGSTFDTFPILNIAKPYSPYEPRATSM
jgi:hypothetical protein